MVAMKIWPMIKYGSKDLVCRDGMEVCWSVDVHSGVDSRSWCSRVVVIRFAVLVSFDRLGMDPRSCSRSVVV